MALSLVLVRSTLIPRDFLRMYPRGVKLKTKPGELRIMLEICFPSASKSSEVSPSLADTGTVY